MHRKSGGGAVARFQVLRGWKGSADTSSSGGRPAMTRFRSLKHRNFQLFIVGQLVSLIGTWMQTTAQLWLVYKLTGSAALLGVFGFASQVPMLFLSSIGGDIRGRYEPQPHVGSTPTAGLSLSVSLSALTHADKDLRWP